MQPIIFDRTSYCVNGEPVYLYSGEFHYFRVPREDWRRRMVLFKEAGGNCLATYIPWLIHEPVEETFVFGDAGPQHDLEAFLQTALEMELYVIARPGPYQYSELVYAGLPRWLYENYPQLRAKTCDGKDIGPMSISYLHPLFLEKARRWFDVVCPIIARYTISSGGPVAFAQFDNELTGIHEWFGGLDYNAETMGFGRVGGRYPVYLRGKYGDVAALNHAHGTAYTAFEDVPPPAPSSLSKPPDIRRMKDYFDFYLGTVAEYAQTLVTWMRASGIDVPMVHNSANPEMNAYFLETVEALGDDFVLGSDHYYNLDQTWAQNNPTPQYAAKVFVSLEMLRLMGFPPTVFELPGGSASNWPPITPEDALACYMTNLAYGMRGHNFYIFTGGPNLPGTGDRSDSYDYGASISATGEVRPLYSSQKALGDFIATYPWFVTARRESDCRIALDFEYVRANTYWKGGDFRFTPPQAWDFLRRGVVTTAFCASLSPALCDLRDDAWTEDVTTPVIFVTADSMAADKQARIVRFLRNGGRALIAPLLPTLDEALNPCTILADFLGAAASTTVEEGMARFVVDGTVHIMPRALFAPDMPSTAEVITADEATGRPVIWRWTAEDGGQAMLLGVSWIHALREHEALLTSLLRMLNLRQKVVGSNPNVWTSLWRAGDRTLLFALNLLTGKMEAHIQYRLDDALIDAGVHTLNPMTVTII
ncbi:MAG TPA: beta-galactosidase [Anaerolineae bacterium]|nr:beta-galactosidase [Anaerolineae bacterium]HQI87216.1 beta-galactosidase [Anaerolineae bacterium]